MKQRHYYLNKLGIKSDSPCIYNSTDIEDSRIVRFAKERSKHGFDSRETWSMNFTSACWVYEHLMMYKDIGGKVVDLNFHKFDIPVLYEIPDDELVCEGENKYPTHYLRSQTETKTELESINLIIQYLEYYLTYNDKEYYNNIDVSIKCEAMAYEYLQGGFRIYAEILPALWW